MIRISLAWIGTVILGSIVSPAIYMLVLDVSNVKVFEWNEMTVFMYMSAAMSAGFSLPYVIIMLTYSKKPISVRLKWHHITSLITAIAVLTMSFGDGMGFLICALITYYLIGGYLQFFFLSGKGH